MNSLSSRDAKNNFGRMLDMTHKGPVAIEKHGRKVAVILSTEDYEHLQACEDAYWIRLAEEGEASGYIGVEETEKWMRKILSAKD